MPRIGPRRGDAGGGRFRRPSGEPEEWHCKKSADRHLQQRKQPGAGEIHVEADGGVDRYLECRRARAPAEREHDGEACEAQKENQDADRRCLAPKNRPVENAEDGPGRHPELRGKPPVLAGNRGERGEEDACGERRIEEDVSNQDAGEPVEPAAGVNADKPQALPEPPGAPQHLDHREHDDDRRQDTRQVERRDEEAATRKSRSSRKRQRQRRA